MDRKILIFFLLGMFLISGVSAWNFPSTDGILKNITTTYVTYYNNVTDEPLWLANYTNLLDDCGTEFVIGMFPNGTLICADVSIGSETDPYWSANYSAFNSSWSNTFNQTTNDSINNYIATISGGAEPLWTANYTAFNDTWSSTFNQTTNNSINNYINSNNQSVTNTFNLYVLISTLVDRVGNWSLDKINYYTKTEVNDINTSMRNYVIWVNSTNTGGGIDTTWLANWTAYNSSWSSTYNQTTNDSINNYIFSNNNSIVNYITVQNTSMKNYVDSQVSYDDAWINYTTNLTYVPYTGAYNNVNLGVYDLTAHNLYSAYLGGTLGALDMATNEWLLSANLSPATTLTYSLGSGANRWDWLYVRNISAENIDVLNNLNFSGNVTASYYFGDGSNLINLPEGSELKWNGNWTTFLTHITWAEVMNGTLFLTSQWNATNESYLSWATALNGTLFLTSQWNATNESYMTGSNFTLQNISMNNFIIYNNETVMQILNNGSYFNTIGDYDDSWINNTIDNKILVQNDSVVNYIAVQNSSLVNYIGIQNTSIVNWISNVFNVTRNNYVADVNLSMKNYVDSIGEARWDANFSAYNSSWSNITNYSYVPYTGATGNVNLGIYNITSNLFNGKFNWTSADTWNIFDGYFLSFNETKFNETLDNKLLGKYWFFTNENLVYGTSQGTLSLTNQFDDYDTISYNLTEDTPDGLEYYANTSNNITSDVNKICFRYKADGDGFVVSLYSISLGTWEGYLTMSDNVIFNWACADIRDTTDHIVDDKLLLRILDAGSASIQHKLYIDAMYVSSGYTPRIGNEVDPNSFHINENLDNTGYNITANYFFGNGSQLTDVPAVETNWNSNYSEFLTHIDWNKITNGSIWSWVMNGTIAKSSELNNGSYFNIPETDSLAYNGSLLWAYQWNSTNTSYALYDTLMNGSFFNPVIIDTWIANYSLYYTKTDINNFNSSYLNTTNSTYNLWAYNQTIPANTYTDIQNGSIVNWITSTFSSLADTMTALGNWSADKGDYMKFTNWNATNTSYLEIKNWNATNESYVSVDILNNGSYLNYPWNSTNTSYALDSELNNGSYFNIPETDSLAYNGSLALTSTLNNGSYLNYPWNATNESYMTGDNFTLQNISMKNYVDSIGEPRWDANYSTFLSNNISTTNYINSNNQSIVNWANSVFVSITTLVDRVGNWSADKGDYYPKTDIDNFNVSYLYTFNQTTNDTLVNYILYVNSTNTGINTDTFVQNYSQFLLNNESLTNYIESNNVSIENYILYVNSTNTGTDTDTFIANYSQFLLNNQSLTNYIESNNISIENYILWVNSTNTGTLYDDSWINSTIDAKDLVQNNSIVNWITNVFNVTRNNYLIDYVLTQNTSLVNYFAIQNTSMRNYVLWVNSTNGAGGTDTFIANYSVFLTHATQTYVDNQNTSQTNDMNSRNLSITNSIASNNVSVTNTFGLYTLITTLVDRVGNWSLDKINYYTKTDINNFNVSYLSITNTSYMTGENFTLQNTSMRNYVINANTTLYQILNNGSYFNTANGEPLWQANWTTFLTHMTMANATIQNQSLVNYIGVQNTSMKNYVDSQDILFNTSQNNYIAQNNASVVNWVNVVFAKITDLSAYVTWSGIWAQVYNETEVNAINTSMKNYADTTMTAQNTSQTNYINAQNTSVTNALNTKLNLAGGTMTGNLNITNSNLSVGSRIILALNTCGGMVSGEICRNATGVFIKG